MPPELRAMAEPPAPTGDHPWQRPRVSALYTWLFMLAAPITVFLFLTAPGLAAAGAPATPMIAMTLFVLATALMSLTSFTNPGTIPLPLTPQRREDMPSSVLINDVPVPCKFCPVCGMVRPVRATHCREMDRCIDKWDHYCPWVGTSVGRRNYRWFVSFVLTTLALGICLSIGSLQHLMLLAVAAEPGRAPTEPPRIGASSAALPGTTGTGGAPTARASMPAGMPAFLRVAGTAPASCALLAYGSIASALLGMLASYHLYLILVNQTTYEHVRGAYESTRNPFDRGPLRNIAEVFCPRAFPPPPTGEPARADVSRRAFLQAALTDCSRSDVEMPAADASATRDQNHVGEHETGAASTAGGTRVAPGSRRVDEGVV